MTGGNRIVEHEWRGNNIQFDVSRADAVRLLTASYGTSFHPATDGTSETPRHLMGFRPDRWGSHIQRQAIFTAIGDDHIDKALSDVSQLALADAADSE